MEMVFRWVQMSSTPHNTDLRLELDGGAHANILGQSLGFGKICQQHADDDKLSSSLFSDSPDCHGDQWQDGDMCEKCKSC